MKKNIKKVIRINLISVLAWPILFSLGLFKYMLSSIQVLYLIGSVPSFILAIIFDLDGKLVIYWCALPSLIIWFVPVIQFIQTKKERVSLYFISSFYSLLSCVLGTLVILGQHV